MNYLFFTKYLLSLIGKLSRNWNKIFPKIKFYKFSNFVIFFNTRYELTIAFIVRVKIFKNNFHSSKSDLKPLVCL